MPSRALSMLALCRALRGRERVVVQLVPCPITGCTCAAHGARAAIAGAAFMLRARRIRSHCSEDDRRQTTSREAILWSFFPSSEDDSRKSREGTHFFPQKDFTCRSGTSPHCTEKKRRKAARKVGVERRRAARGGGEKTRLVSGGGETGGGEGETA